MTKIVVIGGCSYSWGPTFLRDIFVTPELKSSTSKKMLDDLHLDFHLEKTLSLDEALEVNKMIYPIFLNHRPPTADGRPRDL